MGYGRVFVCGIGRTIRIGEGEQIKMEVCYKAFGETPKRTRETGATLIQGTLPVEKIKEAW